MKKNLFFATLAILFTSCASDETIDLDSSGDTTSALQISTSVLTRTTRATSVVTRPGNGPVMGTNLPDGSQIGVSVFNSGATSGAYQNTSGNTNMNWTLSGSAWSGAPFYLQNRVGDVYAYFPFNANATDMDAIPVKPGHVDYMYGTKTNVSKAQPKADIAMNHALAMISFTFNRINYPGECLLQSIIVKNLPTVGTMNLTSGDIALQSGEEATGDMNIDYFQNNTYSNTLPAIPTQGTIGTMTEGIAPAFHAMVLPMEGLPTTITNDKLYATIQIDNTNYNVTLDVKNNRTSGSTAWERGKHYTYNLTLSGSSLVISSVTVNKWTSGGFSNIPI